MTSKEKLNKISELLFKIESLELATVFFKYSGHTKDINISLYPGKWHQDYPDKEIIYITHYDSEKAHKNILYKDLIIYLQECIINQKIIKP